MVLRFDAVARLVALWAVAAVACHGVDRVEGSLKDLSASLQDPVPEDEYPKVIEDGVWERAQDNTAYLTERDPQNDDADKCDWAAYVQVYDSTKERIQELGYECYDAIHALSTRPFGPPSEWERTRVTCYGVCADYFLAVRDSNNGGECNCKKLQGSEMWDRYRKREEYSCWLYPTFFECELVGTCYEDPHWWFRHVCRGCGWQALNEDQWREERDPDFGCPGVRATPMLVVALAVAAVAAWAARAVGHA